MLEHARPSRDKKGSGAHGAEIARHVPERAAVEGNYSTALHPPAQRMRIKFSSFADSQGGLNAVILSAFGR